MIKSLGTISTLLSLLILTILTTAGFQNCSEKPLVLGTNSSASADANPDSSVIGLRFVLINGNKSLTGSVGNNVVIKWDFGDRQFNDLTVRMDKADTCADNLGVGAINETGLKDNVRKRASPQGNIHKWTSC